TYSQLGRTPPITEPASSTDVPPGTLPPGMLPPGTPQNTGTQHTQTPQITPADQGDYLKAAECMRSLGIPDFPDPTFGNNTVTFNVPPNIDPNSSQAKSAVATCSKLIPPRLPYRNRSDPGMDRGRLRGLLGFRLELQPDIRVIVIEPSAVATE